jgi:hypothetical protein
MSTLCRDSDLGEATFHAAYGQLRLTQFNSASACPLAKRCPHVARCTAIQPFFRQSGSDACANWLPVDLRLSKCE